MSRLNKHLESFEDGPAINDARQQISKECEKRGSDPKGLFTLSVPTGGGKTLASLRFALRHAKTNDLERIVYIIPYTSIIDQNAQVARNILEVDEEFGSVVLEHHSNILPEKETWQNKLLAENWDAPGLHHNGPVSGQFVRFAHAFCSANAQSGQKCSHF